MEPARPGEIARLFLRLGATVFGGPAAHLAVFREEVVVRRRWLSDAAFADLVGAASLLPGPTSTEVAIGIGREKGGIRGMLLAGIAFILPAALLVLVAAMLYDRTAALPATGWILAGVAPVVVLVVLRAARGLVPTAMPGPAERVVAIGALVAGLAGLHPLAVVAVAALVVALLRERRARSADGAAAGAAVLVAASGGALAAVATTGGATGGAAAATGGVTGGAAAVAAGPVALAAGAAATGLGLAGIFGTFLVLGCVTFGSGYLLLTFLNDALVAPGLVDAQVLLDAVAIGQVTPGPLFTTATFLGYQLGGIPGAVAATIGIFLPAFVLVAAFHPLLPRIRASRRAGALLDGVNAAAVGLIGGTAVVLAPAAFASPAQAAIGVVGGLLLLSGWLGPTAVLLLGAGAGLLLGAAGGLPAAG
ncbi:MAG: chromate efflux transporter [Chloroflexota bacterium]